VILTKFTNAWASWLSFAFLLPFGGAQGKDFRVLHSFALKDGIHPYASLIRDKNGSLYGTNSAAGSQGYGTVFRVAPDGTLSVLYAFKGGPNDGAAPAAAVLKDNTGNLYGTTIAGGANSQGTVFRLAPDGTETVLHNFGAGTDGRSPYAVLIADKKGRLYGTTAFGGANDSGTVFRLTPGGKETVLHSFEGDDGANPFAGLTKAASGSFYGTTNSGGEFGLGTVFKMDSHGTVTVIHSFAGGSTDGAGPYGALAIDSEGNLYGTTYQGGSARDTGTVFKIAPDGTETVIYAFSTANDGAYPDLVRPLLDDARNIYGTTGAGGMSGNGIVFKIDANGVETILHDFGGSGDGASPYSGLIADTKGHLYGTAFSGGAAGFGNVFRLNE